MGIIATLFGVATQAEETTTGVPFRSGVDWSTVQPVASVSVHRLKASETPQQYVGRDGLYLIEGKIVDARSGQILVEPRLITERGAQTTIEIGRVEQIVIKLTVMIAATGSGVVTTTELRNAGALVSTSTTPFAFDHR